MIGMKMTESYELEVIEVCMSLSKSEETAAASIYEHAGLAVNPDNVGRRRTGIICDGASRAENL
jgi:hypothetical protein